MDLSTSSSLDERLRTFVGSSKYGLDKLVSDDVPIGCDVYPTATCGAPGASTSANHKAKDRHGQDFTAASGRLGRFAPVVDMGPEAVELRREKFLRFTKQFHDGMERIFHDEAQKATFPLHEPQVGVEEGGACGGARGSGRSSSGKWIRRPEIEFNASSHWDGIGKTQEMRAAGVRPKKSVCTPEFVERKIEDPRRDDSPFRRSLLNTMCQDKGVDTAGLESKRIPNGGRPDVAPVGPILCAGMEPQDVGGATPAARRCKQIMQGRR